MSDLLIKWKKNYQLEDYTKNKGDARKKIKRVLRNNVSKI